MLRRVTFRRLRAGATALAHRFAVSTRGNVAMIFALCLPVLVMFTMGGVDINRASTVRVNLQDALDAAALAAARSSATSNADINAIGLRVLRSNLAAYPEVTLSSSSFELNSENVVISNATVNVKTLVAAIVLPPYGKLLEDYMPVSAHSEVNRSAKDLEVAMVLDITGSMSGTDIADLQNAANSLVDVIVKDQQSPYTSRMSIVPYSMGVNMGTRAAAARGAITPGLAVSKSTKSCSTSYSTTTCTVVITSNGHGFVVGDRVVIGSATGSPSLNSTVNTAYSITAKTTNTFTFSVGRDVTVSNSGGSAKAYCTKTGCEYLAFTNMDGGTSVQRIGTCVTERTGGQAYTDASPSTNPVGRNYAMNETSNACPSSQLQPLTDNKTTLKSLISNLQAVGSTAGHIGTAWGWYTLAPNFNTLWPTANAANAYNGLETVKAVVLMTDGDFNTPYRDGVIAGDALTGSGANSNKIYGNATNGASASQATQLCTAMKARGITVYTVAFSVAANSPAATLLNSCASSADKAFVASSGTEMVSAFQAIGRDITQLRISR